MPALPPLPATEANRLARLRELFVLDTAPEPAFDAIARMAAQACDAPIALITLIDGHRQWFKAKVGATGIDETAREEAFCAHTVLSDAMLIVPDAPADPRFAENPFVQGPTAIRFYAGAPLILPCGERVGTLCVLDVRQRTLDAQQGQTLRSLADLVTQTLLMRRDLMNKSMAAQTEHDRALAATVDEMADLYDNAPCGFHSLDSTGRFVRLNDTALRWLGCAREEVVGQMRITDFLNAEGLALFQQRFPVLMRDGVLDDVEFDLVGRAGETRRVIASATVIKDAHGVPTFTRTVMYDITELQRTRDALRQLTAEQQSVLDTDLIGILKLRDRRIVWANRGAERLFGYGPGELLGQPTRVLYADAEAHRLGGEVAYRDMTVGKVFRSHLHGRRKSGEPLWLDVSGTTPPDDPGNVLCMFVDVTAFKKAEENRLRALALEAENHHLAEIGRVKGAFLSSMSHELRTPLNAVIGYTHLLQAGTVRPDSPKFMHYVGQIGASGRQLLGLIETVLNFAQVDAGQMAFRPEALQLKPVLQGVVETLRADSFKKGIYLTTEIDPDLGEVVLDELRLGQVVSHYVSNAIKFSDEGGTVTLRAWAQGATDLRIEVEDSGIGIAESDVARLFVPFQQLSEGHAKAFPGAGLGLALARRLVEAQGGSVGVHSRLGVGSVFWLVLPRRALAPESLRR